jgi:hypothetical protein
MQGFHRLDLRLQCVLQVSGQEGRAILPALAASDHDAVLAAVHVLEAQAEARQQAQAAAIEPPRHEGVPARHRGEPPLDFRLGAHGGRPGSACAADRGALVLKGLVQDLAVENHQGVQGLPLGRGRHRACGGQVGENALHILGPEPVRMGLAAAGLEIAPDPVAIDRLGAVGIAIITEHLAHLVHQREAGMRVQCRCIFMVTFHNFLNTITIDGNQPGKTPYMDSTQPHVPDHMMKITIRGTSVHLSGVIWQTTFR